MYQLDIIIPRFLTIHFCVVKYNKNINEFVMDRIVLLIKIHFTMSIFFLCYIKHGLL